MNNNSIKWYYKESEQLPLVVSWKKRGPLKKWYATLVIQKWYWSFRKGYRFPRLTRKQLHYKALDEAAGMLGRALRETEENIIRELGLKNDKTV